MALIDGARSEFLFGIVGRVPYVAQGVGVELCGFFINREGSSRRFASATAGESPRHWLHDPSFANERCFSLFLPRTSNHELRDHH